jgi:hypothetical protein
VCNKIPKEQNLKKKYYDGIRILFFPPSHSPKAKHHSGELKKQIETAMNFSSIEQIAKWFGLSWYLLDS